TAATPRAEERRLHLGKSDLSSPTMPVIRRHSKAARESCGRPVLLLAWLITQNVPQVCCPALRPAKLWQYSQSRITGSLQPRVALERAKRVAARPKSGMIKVRSRNPRLIAHRAYTAFQDTLGCTRLA